MAPRRTPVAVISSLGGPLPAYTTWTSTGRSTRSAITTRSTTAPTRPGKTGWTFRSVLVRRWGPPATNSGRAVRAPADQHQLMIRAIVFDFDGVLADSEPLHLRAYQEVLANLGVTLSRDEYYAAYLGYDDAGVFSGVATAHGWQMDQARLEQLIAEKGRVFDQAVETMDVLYPAAIECIRVLAAQFPLGIASGALKPEIETVLRRARLEPHFRFIVASGDTPRSKPAPDPYVRAAELHGMPPGCC